MPRERALRAEMLEGREMLAAAPILKISGADTAIEGVPYQLNLAAEGPGAATITQWSIDWGDGQQLVVPGNPSLVEHQYADSGATHRILATVTNADGSYLVGKPGTLDAAFRNDGWATQNFTDGADYAYGAALDSNGKLVVVGSGDDKVFRVLRYNADGTSLDASFGQGGVVTTNLGMWSEAHAVAIQADGKIVVAGWTYDGSGYDFALVRYNTNGSLDTTFGQNQDGKVKTDFYNGSSDSAYALKLDASQRIVVAGRVYSGGNYDFALARYTTGGSLDTSFGAGGLVSTDFRGGNDEAWALAFDSSWNIVVAGRGYYDATRRSDFAVARYLASSGQLDTAFGKPMTDFGYGDDYAYAVAVKPGGQIVAAGYGAAANYSDVALAQYNPTNGALDTGFGTGGKVLDPVSVGWDYVYAMTLQGDNAVVAGGFYNGASGQDMGLARYLANGQRDDAFNNFTGKRLTDFGSGNDFACALATDASGNLVAAGYGIQGTSNDIALARYTAGGLLDTGFGSSGKVQQGFAGSYDQARALTEQEDGKILVAGDVTSDGKPDFGLMRFNPDGSPDTSFGIAHDGKARTDFSGGIDAAYAVALQSVVQSDGKIVVAGYAYNGSNSYDFALARYTKDGILDETFGNGGKVTTPMGASIDMGYALAVLDDDSILVAGSAQVGSHYEFALAKYTRDGAPDLTFGASHDGKVIIPVGSGNAAARALAVQPDAMIVLAGYAVGGSNDDFALARVTSAGQLDTTFGIGGTVLTPVGSSWDFASAVAVQPDGKIVAAGRSSNGHDYDFALVRYTGLGQLDASFNSSGKATLDFAGGYDEVLGLAIEAGGKIVAAGRSSNGANDDIALARYTAAGKLDGTFGDQGKTRSDLAGGWDYAQAITVLKSGDLMVAGPAWNGSEYDFTLARYFGSAGGRVVSTLPAAPTALAAVAVNGGQIDLTWQDNSAIEFGYTVEQLIDGAWETVEVLEANATSVSISGVFEPSIAYDFRVRAWTAWGEWQLSDPVSVTTPAWPTMPGNLTATAVSGTEIGLSWTASTAATSYSIAMQEVGGGDWNVIGTTALTEFHATGLTAGGTKYSFRVAAVNSYGSSPFAALFNVPTVNLPPTVAAPTAGANPVTGTSATLAVTANDDGGESRLIYTWSVLSGGDASFSQNGRNAAKNTTVTFCAAGTYGVRVAVTDASGSSVNSSTLSVTVNQTLTTIEVTPADAAVLQGTTRQFSAAGFDQFGDGMTTPPSFTWAVGVGGVGTISQSGLYTAPSSGNDTTFTVCASAGGETGTANVAFKKGNHVVIDFNDLAVGTVVTDQYAAKGIIFSCDPGFTNKVTSDWSSNTIGTWPLSSNNYDRNLYVDFLSPVNNLTFQNGIQNPNDGQRSGTVRIYQNGQYSASVPIPGAEYQVGTVDLSAYQNITRIEIVDVSMDFFGLVYDNFSFGAETLLELTVADHAASTNRATAITDAAIKDLYVAEDPDTESADVDIDAVFAPSDADDDVYLTIKRSDGTVIAHDYWADLDSTQQTLEVTDQARDFVITAWLDSDHDQVLDADEDSREVAVHVLNAVLDAPGAIDADTHEALVAAVFGPFYDPDVADAIEGKTVKFEVLRNGVRSAILSGTIEAGVAAVRVPTSTTPGDQYRVIAKALGFSLESEPFTIVAGAPSQIASQLSKTSCVSDGTDQITITATIRDQFGNLVEDGTPVAWTLKDASSHFAAGGSQVVAYTTNGQATATVVAPELPGTQEVYIVAGEAEHTVSIPVTFTAASLTGPADLDLANSQSGTVTLSTNAANGTPVFWTISNGDVRTIAGTVSNGSASIQVTAAGTWGRVGPCVVTATVGGRITYHQIQFYTSDPYYVELDRFVLCGDVTQDGVETITYPSASPLRDKNGFVIAPQVVPNWTVDVAYYAEANVTIHGVPGGIYFVDFADSTSAFIAEIAGTDAYGRVQLDGTGTAVVLLRSKGVFDGNPLTPEFANVPVRVRPADPNNPFVAQPPGTNDRVVTAKYVEHGWWTRTWDACQGFFGGDPETAAGVGANVAGGMLIVGDVGSLVKNGWRAAGGSDTPVNYAEVGLSGLGLATEIAVGAGELADAPISGVRSLLAALGNVPAGKILPILYKRFLSNAADMATFVKFLGKMTNETAFQVLKNVLTSEDLMLAAIKASDELGEAVFTGLKNVSAHAYTGGIAAAQKITKVLSDLPEAARTFFKGLHPDQLSVAVEHMGMIFAGGKIDQAMLGKLLTHDGLFSATYDRMNFLADLRQVADAEGLEKLVNEGALLSYIPNFRRGALYELQSAVAIKAQGGGSNITFLRKYAKVGPNPDDVTDIDFIIDGVYYQAKSGWSGETAEKALAWIKKAQLDGATEIKYVCPGGRGLVPADVLKVLDNERGYENALGRAIEIVDVPIP